MASSRAPTAVSQNLAGWLSPPGWAAAVGSMLWAKPASLASESQSTSTTQEPRP